jgi:hypothetical protein
MKIGILLLKVFGLSWIIGATLFILYGYWGVWMKGGFSAVAALLSPLSVVNWIVTVITLSPGLGALVWADKLKVKTPAK